MPISGLLQVQCTRSDGATVSATLTANPTTDALTGATVVNGASGVVEVITVDGAGVERRASVNPGTTTFSVAQLAAAGLHTLDDAQTFTVTCA